jgi:hypothetical protein
LPEAAIMGKQCLALTNPIMGYSPVDSIRSATIRDLVERFVDLTRKKSYFQYKLMHEVHLGSNVINRILKGLYNGEIFNIPYIIDEEKINTSYMSLKWIELNILSVNGPGFDFLSFKSRIIFLNLLRKNGLMFQLISQKNFSSFLLLFLSNFTYRKFRNYSLRSIPSNIILFIYKQRMACLAYLNRIFNLKSK